MLPFCWEDEHTCSYHLSQLRGPRCSLSLHHTPRPLAYVGWPTDTCQPSSSPWEGASPADHTSERYTVPRGRVHTGDMSNQLTWPMHTLHMPPPPKSEPPGIQWGNTRNADWQSIWCVDLVHSTYTVHIQWHTHHSPSTVEPVHLCMCTLCGHPVPHPLFARHTANWLLIHNLRCYHLLPLELITYHRT